MIDTIQTIDTLTTIVNEVVSTGIAIHENTGGGQLINGIDNGVIGSFVSLLIAGFIRYFEKRKLKRKYKDNE
jgi:hypothetical protein